MTWAKPLTAAVAIGYTVVLTVPLKAGEVTFTGVARQPEVTAPVSFEMRPPARPRQWFLRPLSDLVPVRSDEDWSSQTWVQRNCPRRDEATGHIISLGGMGDDGICSRVASALGMEAAAPSTWTERAEAVFAQTRAASNS